MIKSTVRFITDNSKSFNTGFFGFITFTIFILLRMMSDDIKLISGGIGLLDSELMISSLQVHDIITRYGAEGRSFYHCFQLVDTVYSLAYATSLALLISFLLQKPDASAYQLNII